MADNGFWRDKFFYVVLILCIGSWGWATFLFFANLGILNGHCAEAKADMTALELKDETNKKEIQVEIKDMLEKINNGFQAVATNVASLQTEVINLKEVVKKKNGR